MVQDNLGVEHEHILAGSKHMVETAKATKVSNNHNTTLNQSNQHLLVGF